MTTEILERLVEACGYGIICTRHVPAGYGQIRTRPVPGGYGYGFGSVPVPVPTTRVGLPYPFGQLMECVICHFQVLIITKQR